MSTLWTSNPSPMQDVIAVPVPQETETYVPVPYADYIGKLIEQGEDKLLGFNLESRKYGLAREGNFLFGLHTYKDGSDNQELAVGFRTSYNKLLANSMAIGSQVIVCENLMLTGDIVVMRKHTKNVWNDLDAMLGKGFGDAPINWDKSLRHEEVLRNFPIGNDEAYGFLGNATGRKILALRQFKRAMDEWRQPSHNEHGKGNAWTLYQAITESLKSTPIHNYMEKHRAIERLFVRRYNLKSIDSAQEEIAEINLN
jgi:hypothetical protein